MKSLHTIAFLRDFKLVIKTTISTSILILLIVFGAALFFVGYKFLGLFNYLTGCLIVYLLCWDYFERKLKEVKKSK